jgi:Pyruvate/2-oxoacid:ferredoxin oxidoreductase delta subunit
MNNITEEMLDELRETVMQSMSQKRFRHTVAVEEMVARLCALFCPEHTLKLRAAALQQNGEFFFCGEICVVFCKLRAMWISSFIAKRF